MTELQGVIGFEGIGINAWMVWVLPFIGAALIPAIAKAGDRVKNYVAVGFALASAIFAAHCYHWELKEVMFIVR